eukprot:CAMPEP_0180687652 /NCGR_PEP_ID=MMETSP1037_2-20121125/73572_1 /TAXON_ID=632150 /ORGANISM="Azadinium spinosum, Strain 3D9" /LENGTH=50 /DNA_ID=CAMNT_0022718461 /DNA_START=544 /DNA_END=696 /DNA_ORIENTATION=+
MKEEARSFAELLICNTGPLSASLPQLRSQELAHPELVQQANPGSAHPIGG